MFLSLNSTSGLNPAYRVKIISDDSFSYQVALPGYKKEDVQITTPSGGKYLKISSTPSPDTSNYPVVGFSVRPFAITWALSKSFKVAKATMENGVLEILMEKIAEEPDDLIPIL